MDIKELETYLIDNAHKLTVQESLSRIRDIDKYFTHGIDPPWATVTSDNPLILMFYKTAILKETFLDNYQKILNMNLLDKCSSFSLYPKLKFEFDELK